jgi:hypothetical protein
MSSCHIGQSANKQLDLKPTVGAQDGNVLESCRGRLFLVLSRPSSRLPDVSDRGRDRFSPLADLLVIAA